MFRNVKDFIKHEFLPKEPGKIEFELKEEESDSTAEDETEDEEPQTPCVRRLAQERRKPERYSPSVFHSNFALSIIDDYPRTVKEVVDSEDGKLWKRPWLMKWNLCTKMRVGIWWSFWLEGNPFAANGCSRRR